MSSSTEESVDEQVSPPEVKQTVVERHPAWEEVDNGLISTPKSNDQVSTSILTGFFKRWKDCESFQLTWRKRYNVM